ncbi:MAG: 30S ribosomal protein S16 [Actinomycetota bacterium]
MAVRLRLMRMGKKKQPTYRVVAADQRSPRDGRFIEIVGTYNPRMEPSEIKINNAKAVSWLRKGAQPSERVRKLLEISGAWDAHTSGVSIEDLEAKEAEAKAAEQAEAVGADA